MFEDIFEHEKEHSEQTEETEEGPIYKKAWIKYINSQKRWDASKKEK